MKCKECVHYKLCRDLFCQVDVLTDDDKRCDYFEEARPHGEWIKVGGLFYHLKCSNCNFELKSPDDKSIFCPNCGADMREGDPDDRRRD